MTSLLTPPTQRAAAPTTTRRPLVLIAGIGGLVAALGPLTVCLILGVIGWFVSDAGAHGAPRDGLRVGALGWLMAHGSGIHVGTVAITVVPLGLTAICAWATWRFGLRVGESVSGHGPDADAIADGQRDFTVPSAVAVFGAAYGVVAVVTGVLAATPATQPSLGRALLGSLGLTLLVAAPAIAIGSGRAAIWAASVPLWLRSAMATAVGVVVLYLGVSALVLAVSLAVDFVTAANVLAALHIDAGDSALFTLVAAGVTPNAVLFSGSYLLGPGFAVGTGTLVSPSAVVLGPVPAFPLLAALPDPGPVPGWVIGLMALPVLAGVVAAARTYRRFPTLRWDEGALHGLIGGVLAGFGFAFLALLAGGAVGPGRMRDVSPYAFDVLVHSIAAFGIGGLLGGALMTALARRAARSNANGSAE